MFKRHIQLARVYTYCFKGENRVKLKYRFVYRKRVFANNVYLDTYSLMNKKDPMYIYTIIMIIEETQVLITVCDSHSYTMKVIIVINRRLCYQLSIIIRLF